MVKEQRREKGAGVFGSDGGGEREAEGGGEEERAADQARAGGHDAQAFGAANEAGARVGG